MEEDNEVRFQDIKRKMIFAYTGAFLGFILVKALVFNGAENMGWALFWDAVFKGKITFDGLLEVMAMSGFIKLVVGTVIGFKLGEWYEDGTIKKFIDDIQKDNDEDNKGETK